ncbi:MAG: hypothetical protein NZ805_02055 [Armatimonadetes bacterium]|nr:hypothetical protein [Armatimonadota bacterium]MDW8026845.1 hypothetical protein [Armatimonadota bacterium]
MTSNLSLRFLKLCLVLAAWAWSLSFSSEPTDRFLCQREWDSSSEISWIVEGGNKSLSVRLSKNRCSFALENEMLGWSEILPSVPNLPARAYLLREQFRWSLLIGRRLVAFAFADLPKTEKVDSANFESLPESDLQIYAAPVGWKRMELEDGSVIFCPKDEKAKGLFPLMANLPSLSDFAVSMETQLNGARSVGIGFCWGEDGGYLWRWVRLGGETFWQLALASASNSGLDLTTLYEEPADFPPTSWLNLQVWRSLDQIWVGVDGDLVAQVRDNRFGQGKIVVWLETGDLPLPLVKPLRITRWWCASLKPEVETHLPFSALNGRWTSKLDSWILSSEVKGKTALAILGETELPSWWVADIQWRDEPLGLVFGWVNEMQFNLLRLRPAETVQTSLPKRVVLEIVAIRDGRERVLSDWSLFLEPNALYRLAVLVEENKASGFINSLGLVSAKVITAGKVGFWTSSSLGLKGFWLYKGQSPSLTLMPENVGTVQLLSDLSIAAHESISINLTAGLPPNVPLIAKLSKEPITLYVERRSNRLFFRVERQSQLVGFTETKLPKELPIVVKLERIDRVVLIRLGDQTIWTTKLD